MGLPFGLGFGLGHLCPSRTQNIWAGLGSRATFGPGPGQALSGFGLVLGESLNLDQQHMEVCRPKAASWGGRHVSFRELVCKVPQLGRLTLEVQKPRDHI